MPSFCRSAIDLASDAAVARADRQISTQAIAAGLIRSSFDAMGSPCEVLVQSDDPDLASQVARVAADEAWRVEDKFSRYLPGNIVARINSNGGAPLAVDSETAGLLDFADSLYRLSERRFDITSGVLRKVWTFDGSDSLPAAGEVRQMLAKVGWDKVSWQSPQLTLREGMQIDLGGIGKEYAVDKAAEQVRGLTRRGCLLNFGGDLVVTGSSEKPGGWQVGIESIAETGPPAQKLIRLKAGALATSGDARRFLQKDGRRYGHILDPQTGWPVDDAPCSITVAAETCTQAGMLATLAMLRGAGAEEFLREQEATFWCLRQ